MSAVRGTLRVCPPRFGLMGGCCLVWLVLGFSGAGVVGKRGSSVSERTRVSTGPPARLSGLITCGFIVPLFRSVSQLAVTVLCTFCVLLLCATFCSGNAGISFVSV